jgi:hypothetical protein
LAASRAVAASRVAAPTAAWTTTQTPPGRLRTPADSRLLRLHDSSETDRTRPLNATTARHSSEGWATDRFGNDAEQALATAAEGNDGAEGGDGGDGGEGANRDVALETFGVTAQYLRGK